MGADSKFRGVITALMNPYDRDGNVAEKPLRQHVDFLIRAGVHGLYPCGSAGEGVLLPVEQRERIAEIVIDQAAGRVPVMIHVGAMSTRDTVELAAHAQRVGADGIGIVAPSYYPYTPAQLAQHFTRVAEAAPNLPVYLYNIPSNAKNEIPPKLTAELVAKVPNIVGIKDSSKSISKLMEYIYALSPDADIIVGSDELLLPAVTMGAQGVISAISNVIPEIVVALFNASQAGKVAEARRLQAELIEIRDALKAGPNIGGYKAAIRWRGNSEFRGIYAPLTECTPEEEARLFEALEKQAALGRFPR